ncbi:uncharacterized protein LOC115891153 isoform X3 [Sitophilus oryzae]|uniref:Uncharacterized protein LOC115891153 isoform X3 n=1 Tax=Sitophilus oryzae TaxID=7048 RepID=A0A6J2YVZ1_SITOR|nr:uncharacterized protein LOC115891153 isoform X3 [Sitophilus oryzae]
MTAHIGTFCIKSIKERVSEVNISRTENFCFGEALSSVYPLLDIIFKYLPFSDLRACRDVCSTWREKAEEILLKRTAPSWFTCYKVGSKGLPEYLEEELVPKSVDYCLLSVPRVVSHFNNDRSVKDIQHHGSIFDGIFIPKIPSVRTVMFHCNPSKKREVEDAVQKYIKKNEQVKCALLFCKTQLLESLYTFLEYIIPKNKPRTVALGGGVIRGTKTFQQINPDKKIYTAKDVVCILFLKDTTADIHNFNAYSCVIRGNDLSKEEFNAELEEFRSNIILKNHSLGFRICCSAKYQETELDSFEEIFPQIPLLGLDAYGEIGWNSYPNANLQNEPQKTKRLKRSTVLPIAENIFSTIFILITWD